LLRTIAGYGKQVDKRKEARYHSALENILSGVLGKSGAIPWVMADPLTCDCFLGVDSGGAESRIWSYAYVFDNTGASIGSEKGQPYQNEGIEKGRFKNSIIQSLSSYPKRLGSGKGPNHITIHRDGRLTRTEKEGLLEALDMLKSNGQLEQTPTVTVVDVKKGHSLRVFQRGEGGFKNPFIGSYFILDDRRAVVNTTGRPVLSEQGTAAPLLLEMERISGKSEIQDVARDLFYLTELNWGSPRMDTKMPITIRFAEKRIFYADKGIEYADQLPL
jgi:argonaute-like protein implicated in RNA metabolism and viral defense